MPGFDGTGPRGMGPMTGGGRGFCSPWGIGASLRGGMIPPYPQSPYPFYGGYAPYGSPRGMPYYRGYAPGALPYYGAAPFAPQTTREQELGFLRSEAEALKGQLGQIEARISELETEGG